MVSNSARTVNLTYRALVGFRVVAQISFSLTFGRADSTADFIPPPDIPPVVTNNVIPVSYDLTRVRGVTNPYIVVSYPGLGFVWGPDPVAILPFGYLFANTIDGFRDTEFKSLASYPAPNLYVYSVRLPNLKGTVNVPVAALQGGGIYAVQLTSNNYTLPFCGCGGGAIGLGYPAFVRVQPSVSALFERRHHFSRLTGRRMGILSRFRIAHRFKSLIT